MVVALFALSLVMIVGGVAAVVQGFPFVRLESGLAMVIGGATAASAGVILLGLSAVVLRLARLERSLEARETNLSAPPMPLELPMPVPTAGAAGLDGLTLEPIAGPAGSRLGDAAGSKPRLDLVPSRYDRLDSSETEPAPAAASAPPSEGARAERIEPDFSALTERPNAAVEDDLFVPGRPTAAAEGREQTGAPTDLGETAPVNEASEGERVVAGTYASGGNTYVMYADGSIEADTPRGRFTFGSLAELKAFVEAGGESGDTRGAA